MMKKLKNVLLALTLVIAATAFWSVKAEASTTATYKYTDNTITISWKAPTADDLGAYRTLASYSIYDTYSKQYVATNIPADATSYTVKKLSKGFISRWRIDYQYIYSYDGSTKDWTGWSYAYVNTTPPTYSTSKFGISSASTTSKCVYFQVPHYSSNFVTGAQIQVYKGTKKVKDIKFSSYSDKVSVSLNTAYKYRVRLYYTNDDTQKTCYGDWSKYKFFDLCSTTYSTTYGVRGTRLTLKGVKNVNKYVIYVSLSYDSGYKKTATVNVSTGKKKTVNITKKGSSSMKKGKSYYIRVVPYIKSGSSQYKSDVYSYFSIYNNK